MASIITTMPKELLALIFKNLTKPNDRRRAAQVCKLFYEIVRHQSTLKKDNMLRMTNADPEASPIRVFENSHFFSFSKLRIVNWHQNIVLESAFWTLHGHKISELIVAQEIEISIETFLNTLSEYFLNLKKLTFDVSKFSDTGNPVGANSQNISLPIEDLTLRTRTMPLDHIMTLLRCSPQLKHLEINRDDEKQLPQIIPWLDSIESSRLIMWEKPLEKLIDLPSKVVIDKLTIKGNETPKMIREFFKQPRTIDKLVLRQWDYNEDPFTTPIYFTRDQAMALGGPWSIKKVDLLYGVLEFEGSLDFLGQLSGINSISLSFIEELSNPLYPYYWSLPGTAQKIHEIEFLDVTNLDYLAGLSSVKSLHMSYLVHTSHHRGLSSNEIQILVRNCPNLKKLTLARIDASDADLIGHGDLLPIFTLEKLEFLSIWFAPNITSEVFKGAFKFPYLKYLHVDLRSHISSEEQNFNQNVAMLFTQNCPNLEHLSIDNCPINEEGFVYLIRQLPYLRYIRIQLKGKRHSSSKDKIEELQKE